MKTLLIFAAVLAVSACATQRPIIDKEAVEDFVSVRKPEELHAIRTDSTDTWRELNDYYVIYKTRRGDYLMKFTRRCWELGDQRVVPDKRWDGNTVRARFDTLRGCRIDSIYELSEADSTELQNLGEAPGSRN